MYADDVKIYSIVMTPDDSSRLQTAIDSLVKWAKDWQLPLSPEKTNFMQLNANSQTCARIYVQSRWCYGITRGFR